MGFACRLIQFEHISLLSYIQMTPHIQYNQSNWFTWSLESVHPDGWRSVDNIGVFYIARTFRWLHLCITCSIINKYKMVSFWGIIVLFSVLISGYICYNFKTQVHKRKWLRKFKAFFSTIFFPVTRDISYWDNMLVIKMDTWKCILG